MTPFAKVRLAFFFSILLVFIIDQIGSVHWVFYAVPTALFLTYMVVASSVLSLNAFIPAFTDPKTSQKLMAITFDDGPTPATEKVLDTLRKHQAKATFFCIGNRIEKHPEIVERIVKEGHMLGNHSFSHSNIFPLFSKNKIVDEINQTNRLIEKYTGKTNTLFRPPFGVINPGIARAVSATNQKVIGWNLRSFDTTKGKNKVLEKIKKQLHSGTVLLLHDDREATPEILDAVLQHAQSEGYGFVDVDEIFEI